jgi:hypothetical protein
MLAWRLGSDGRKPAGPSPSEATLARVVLASQLTAGSLFSVTYEPRDPALDPATLSPDIRLILWHDGKRRNALITGGNPTIQGPDEPIPMPQLLGPGPYGFRLPELAPGRYTLCGWVGLKDTRGQLERWCREVRVVSTS